jgi:hypothetical protein
MYISRFASNFPEGSLVCEPLKMRLLRTQIPTLPDHRIVGLYNASAISRKPCYVMIYFANGLSKHINIKTNESYLATGISSIVVEGSWWCYALYEHL